MVGIIYIYNFDVDQPISGSSTLFPFTVLAKFLSSEQYPGKSRLASRNQRRARNHELVSRKWKDNHRPS